MQKSRIEWTDWTWNPITGCTKGCAYCYARKMTENPFYAKAFPYGFKPHFYADRLKEPSRAKAGDKVFVCSMGELFSGNTYATLAILDSISTYSDVTFQLLTKRPEIMMNFSPFPDNCWVGVSATNSRMFTYAWQALKDIKASVKFVSIEPLLDWNMPACDIEWTIKSAGINWLIIGQQTPVKPSTAPKMKWLGEIVEAADRAQIPVFLKNNLAIGADVEMQVRKLRQEFPAVRVNV